MKAKFFMEGGEKSPFNTKERVLVRALSDGSPIVVGRRTIATVSFCGCREGGRLSYQRRANASM